MTPPVIDPERIYVQDEVAELLGMTTPTFAKLRERMIARDGFPRPISCVGRKRWSGARLIAWRDREVEVQAHAAATPANVTNIEAILKSRGALLAGGRRRAS